MQPINWDEVLAVLATALGAIVTIVSAINKLVIAPAKKLLEKYDSRLQAADNRVDEAHLKLEEMTDMVDDLSENYFEKFKKMDQIIEEYRKDIEESKIDRRRLGSSIKVLLRAMLYSEVSHSFELGFRTEASTLRVFNIYEAHKRMGLNGLGEEYFLAFKELPLVEGKTIIEDENNKIKGETEKNGD